MSAGANAAALGVRDALSIRNDRSIIPDYDVNDQDSVTCTRSESHTKLLQFDPGQLELALRGTLVPNATDILVRRDPILDGVVLPDDIVDKLMDYMSALTDDAARTLKHLTAQRVPRGLPVRP